MMIKQKNSIVKQLNLRDVRHDAKVIICINKTSHLFSFEWASLHLFLLFKRKYLKNYE